MQLPSHGRTSVTQWQSTCQLSQSVVNSVLSSQWRWLSFVDEIQWLWWLCLFGNSLWQIFEFLQRRRSHASETDAVESSAASFVLWLPAVLQIVFWICMSVTMCFNRDSMSSVSGTCATSGDRRQATAGNGSNSLLSVFKYFVNLSSSARLRVAAMSWFRPGPSMWHCRSWTKCNTFHNKPCQYFSVTISYS